MICVEELIQQMKISNLVENKSREVVNNWDNLGERFKAIREMYDLASELEYDPYTINLPMTPIEEALWEDIRMLPCIDGRFYPQYPVGKYFVDFGNPWIKMAIEADGKQWHNKKKDAIRDRYLNEMGWVVIRIDGKDCFKEGVLANALKTPIEELRQSSFVGG